MRSNNQQTVHASNTATSQVAASNEYLSHLKTSDPLLQSIKQICGEIDINIEESTGLIYEDELEQALTHMQIAFKKLTAAQPLFDKLSLREQCTGDEQQLQKIYSVVTYYNLAACYQRRGIFKESHEFITKAIENLKGLILEDTQNSSGVSAKYKSLLYLRYYAQIVLQSCAIKSQLQDHNSALISAYDGLAACIKVFKRSLDLCEQEITDKLNLSEPNSSKLKSTQAYAELNSVSSEYGIISETKPIPNQVSNQKQSQRAEYKTIQKKKEQKCHSQDNKRLPDNSNLVSPISYSEMITPSKQRSLSNNQSQVNSTKNGISKRQHSLTSNVRFHLSESEGDEETSLERIHTFNLKTDNNKSSVINAAEINSKKSSKKKLKSLRSLLNLKVLNKKSESDSQHLQSLSTRDNLTSVKNRQNEVRKDNVKMKQCYVEEQAKVRDSFMIESYKILKSLIKNFKRFLAHLILSEGQQFLMNNDLAKDCLELTKDQLLNSKPKISKLCKKFFSLSEIDQLKKNDRYKYIGRNMLGVRKFDDWINNLEIGNIMHLNPINTSELTQNIGKHHEFQKDPMLKKLVLMIVSFFSIATEMRMMVQFDEKDSKVKEDLMSDSEIWHAQSVFFGAFYLPANCPLVAHVSNSYNKHYISTKQVKKEEEKKFLIAKGSQFLQKNTILKQFMLNQITNLEERKQEIDKSLGTGNSSQDINISDNQEHQVLTDYQKHKATVSLATMVNRTNQPKQMIKLQLKTTNPNNQSVKSECSVSPIRQEGNEQLLKKVKYEHLSKYLRIKDQSLEPPNKDHSKFTPLQQINSVSQVQNHIFNIKLTSTNASNTNQPHINNIAINQINAINIFAQTSSPKTGCEKNNQPVPITQILQQKLNKPHPQYENSDKIIKINIPKSTKDTQKKQTNFKNPSQPPQNRSQVPQQQQTDLHQSNRMKYSVNRLQKYEQTMKKTSDSSIVPLFND